jgi:hypothetical protein
MVIFLSQTESTPKHFFLEKKALKNTIRKPTEFTHAALLLHQMLPLNKLWKLIGKGKGKGKSQIHTKTGHEGPEG